MFNQRAHQVVQRPKRQRYIGTLGFVVSVLAETAGTDIKPPIILVTSSKETADLLTAHLLFAVFDLHDDSWILEPEIIR